MSAGQANRVRLRNSGVPGGQAFPAHALRVRLRTRAPENFFFVFGATAAAPGAAGCAWFQIARAR